MQRGGRTQADNGRSARAASSKAGGGRARGRAARPAETDRLASPIASSATQKPATKAAGRSTPRVASKATPETTSGRAPTADAQGTRRTTKAARREPAPGRAEIAAGAAPERSPPPRPLISAGAAPAPPQQRPELDWDDTPKDVACDALAMRWAARGEELFHKLLGHGAAQHEVRVDLRTGRFVWVDTCGRVSAEAHAQVLCSWSQTTSVVSMGWADPLVRTAAVPRIDGMLSERDDVDEEGAWQIAMEAAEASGATYLYRVSAPHAWYFLNLGELSFSPERGSFHPGTPVGLVLRALGDVRQAIESRAEPCDVVRGRLGALGDALFHQAEYTYRGTDWVARLHRTGKRLRVLARRLPRPTFSVIAAGQQVDEWLDRNLAIELIEAVGLLEDEWSLFS